jgi:hypothetical protein
MLGNLNGGFGGAVSGLAESPPSELGLDVS